MIEKTITIVHDNRVYDALRKQNKTNRSFAFFAMAATACLVYLIRQNDQQEKRIQELMKLKGE